MRYQGAFGGVGVLAYGVYMISQAADYTGLKTPAVLGTTTTPGSKFNGTYNGLSIGSGGVALTYAGFTVGGNIIGGKMNGQMGLQPSGGAPLLGYLVGAKYVYGPFTVGIVGEEYWEQGTVHADRPQPAACARHRRRRQLRRGAWLRRCMPNISGTTRRRTATTSSPERSGQGCRRGERRNFNNNVRAQGFLIGNVVNF